MGGSVGALVGRNVGACVKKWHDTGHDYMRNHVSSIGSSELTSVGPLVGLVVGPTVGERDGAVVGPWKQERRIWKGQRTFADHVRKYGPGGGAKH